mmetsp:Transcript_13716/g.34765  ORF Transcript_13716/g.34765 Transcript_13716/m.34765 type:complete len:504 (-) Transcript_13716:120-1631(-)
MGEMCKIDSKDLRVASSMVVNAGWGVGPHGESEVGPRLKDEKKEKLKATFREFDKDHNGYITRDELAEVLRKLGSIDPGDIDDLLAEADTNKNGVIEIDEFVEWLSGGSSDGNLMIEYGEALRPMFDAIDQDHSGVITQKEFVECHGILQGALSLNPIEDEKQDHKVDPFKLGEEADKAFLLVDGDSNRKINFAEFAKLLKDPIVQSGISAEDLIACVSKLAQSLQEVFAGIRMAERGEISEDQPWMLAKLITELADATREFQDTIHRSSLAHEAGDPMQQTRWMRAPGALSVTRLKTMHMRHLPLNMRLVADSVFDVLCVPTPGHTGDSEDCVWLAEAARTLQYISGVQRKEDRQYYRFDRNNGGWRVDESKDADKYFTSVLRGLPAELGVFYILQTHANFTFEICWADIKRALIASVDMGWLTTEGRIAVEEYFENKVSADISEEITKTSKNKLTEEQLNKRVQAYMETKMILRPRMVMAVLSKLNILKVNPTWKMFMTEV